MPTHRMSAAVLRRSETDERTFEAVRDDGAITCSLQLGADMLEELGLDVDVSPAEPVTISISRLVED